MIQKNFSCELKYGESLLSRYEEKYLQPFVAKVPKWLKSYHLTLTSIIWSLLVILFSYFASENIKWMWAVSLAIVLQYFFDYFDGLTGRYRKEGLAKWGYYMDHFLDYLFLCSIFIGYLIIVDTAYKIYVFLLMIIMTGFMVNSFLFFPISSKFRNYYLGLGPTEGRLILIIFNSIIATYSKSVLENFLFFSLILLTLILIFVVYRTQRELWLQDMNKKNNLS